MILVDVMVPEINKTYDFNLDENSQISLIIEEIAGVLNQRQQGEIEGDKEKLILCSYDGQVILDKSKTLKESGIKNGNRLIFL